MIAPILLEIDQVFVALEVDPDALVRTGKILERIEYG